jgi:hypothetical protein
MVAVIASEAKQSSLLRQKLDCFVAALLAMTNIERPPDKKEKQA